MDKKYDMSFIQHVLNRGMWVGENVISEKTIMKLKDKFEPYNCEFSSALLKLIDEVIVNAIDHRYRTALTDRLDFNIDEDGVISIRNTGTGIEIKKYKDVWLPEFLFTRERSGTNLSQNEDSIRITGGLNGYGVKLVNIFSKFMEIETINGGKKYKQLFENNMETINEPIITDNDEEEYTKVRFLLDFDEVCKIDKNQSNKDWIATNWEILYDLFLMRVYQTAFFCNICNYCFLPEKKKYDDCHIYLQNNLVPIEQATDYVELFTKDYVNISWRTNGNKYPFPWEIFIGLNDYKESIVISIVNGIWINDGGSHVNYVIKTLINHFNQILKKEMKVNNSPITESIFTSVFVYIGARQFPYSDINFQSQEKNKLILGKTKLNQLKKTYPIENKIIKKIWNLGKDRIYALLFRKNKKVKKTSLSSIKNYQPPQSKKKHKSQDYTLFITEGTTATTPVKSLLILSKDEKLNIEYCGIYILRGVIPNVEKKSILAICKNKVLMNLMAVMGLDFTKKYTSKKEINTLNFQKVVIATDQDKDGLGHICSLLLCFFLKFWPQLVKTNRVVCRLNTPIVRVKVGRKKIPFYSEKLFEEWQKEHKYGSITYYKGLGTHNNKDIKEMAQNIKETILTYQCDKDAIDNYKIYYSSDSNARKCILIKYKDDQYEYDRLLYEKQIIKISDHFLIETEGFQNETNTRRLKSMYDGLVTVLRKVITESKRSLLNSKMKVFQFSACVTQKMAYHHGDASINSAVIKMGQRFYGSNNIPLLLGISNDFGNIDTGRKEFGAPRYLDVKVNKKIINLLFPSDDDHILDYLICDGTQVIEPKTYYPIIPLCIMESICVPGTGWQLKCWARHYKRIFYNIRRKLKGKEPLPLLGHVWLRGRSHIKLVNEGEYEEYCYVDYDIVDDNTIHLSDLPLRTWASKYISRLQKNEDIKTIINKTSMSSIDIEIVFHDGVLQEIINKEGRIFDDPIIEYLELYSKLTKQLNFVDENGHVFSFRSYDEVFNSWYEKRKYYYTLRIHRVIKIYEIKRIFIINKIRFIELNIQVNRVSKKKRYELYKKNELQELNENLLSNFHKYKSVEDLKKAFKTNCSYNYIDNIRIKEMSKKNLSKLKQQLNDIENKIAVYEQGYASVWLDELDKLEKIIDEQWPILWGLEKD